jgi:hypothetical protein
LLQCPAQLQNPDAAGSARGGSRGRLASPARHPPTAPRPCPPRNRAAGGPTPAASGQTPPPHPATPHLTSRPPPLTPSIHPLTASPPIRLPFPLLPFLRPRPRPGIPPPSPSPSPRPHYPPVTELVRRHNPELPVEGRPPTPIPRRRASRPMGRSPAPATYQLIERRKGTLFLPLVGRSFCCLLSSRSGEFRVDPARILVRCLIQCNSPVYYSRVRAVEKVVFFFPRGGSVGRAAGRESNRAK